MNKRVLTLAVAVPVTALILTACGSGTSSTTGTQSMPGTPGMGGNQSTAVHNTADVTFATNMIAPHRQAIEMAQLAATRASNAQLKTLASRMQTAQRSEITDMTSMLGSWGAATPGDMTGMDGMPGMMSTAEMSALAAASGAAFDNAFLTMMIANHQGAIGMANAELAGGSDARAKTLAQSIMKSQTTEMAQMRAMLRTG